MIPLSLITFSMLFEYIFSFPTFERSVNAVSTFFLWIKFLYFMRIFRPTSKFISIITAVVADMKVFMVVFMVSLVSFSQSMYILSNNNQEDDKFISSMAGSALFTYLISLGDWDTDALGKTD